MNGSPDPAFLKYPFHQWLAQSPHAESKIRYTVAIVPAELSTHQRLILRVIARLDGRDLQKRRENAELIGLIEYTDATGHSWQNHVDVEASALKALNTSQYLDIVFYAFVLPGDYAVSLAICDPATLEHTTAARKTHVAPLKNDPLPALWTGLPAVEPICDDLRPPDVWYLPEIPTALNLPLAIHRPLHLQFLINATPTSSAEASVAALRENMSLLMPALKTLSSLRLADSASLSIDVAVLDLTRRRVVFEQKSIRTLDWPSLRNYFTETQPGIIDVHTLADRGKMLAFFREQVRERLMPHPGLQSGDTEQIVIVLSGPAFFPDQDLADLTPEPAEPHHQLIYIRYRSAQPQVRRPGPGPRPATRAGRIAPLPSPTDFATLLPPMKTDDLQKAAEPLGARLFDAASAYQFRRILAAIVEQLSR